MAERVFQNFRCWHPERISNVINKVAIAVDDATFMATHTPFKTIRDEKSKPGVTSEEELLAELWRCADNDQHAFVVVQGIHGTGKSHLIRWLQNRYQARASKDEIVLLIKRADNSLRQTLIQILDKGLFEGNVFAADKKKLEEATQELSERGLEDALINNLQVAHGMVIRSELTLPKEKQPSNSISKRLESFLFDEVIRDELCSEDGAIKRITRHISGRQKDLQSNDSPAFFSDDFNFRIEIRKQIQRNPNSHENTKALVKKLAIEKFQQDLADYLNNLLEFAIGHATKLTSDYFKQMFFDLRRELQKKGRSLVLFIEDITAFTGLAAGLVDVLAEAHGTANPEFCRLISVIGIVDYYYDSHFPDNMKDRVTHHLTLNSPGDQNKQESHLLKDPDILCDLTVRYLNAIRLTPEQLENWFKNGAEPDELPNHCSECSYRQPCHAAFGCVNVNNAQNKTVQIGLYPFNQQAIITMYNNIIEQKFRTPRTLLNSIVAYVLNNHGQLIERGLFPPPRTEVGNDFSAPNLRDFNQRDLLNHLARNHQEQIESLAVFWGDRTLNKGYTPIGEPTIGGLTAGTYIAFSLPFIGDEIEIKDTHASAKHPSFDEQASTSSLPVRSEPSARPPRDDKEQDPVLINIDNWASGHESLQYYDDLVTLLARFVKESIDWDAHSISPTLVTDRIRQRFFVVEGQAGRISQTYHLFFERSRSLAAALQALHQLNQKDRSLTPAQCGAYLLKLSTWLEETESQIVDFVREPHFKTPSSISSVKLLGQSALWLGCLSGDLSQEATSPSVLFHSLISSCQAIKWADAIDQAQGIRGTKWTQLMARRQISENVASIRSELLEQVNCRQGPRGDLKMLDAATLLDMLQEMKSTDWQLPKCDFRVEDDNQIWTAIRDVHSSLREHFRAVLSAEHQALTNLAKQIGTAIGDHTIAETFAAIQNLLDAFQNAGLGYRSEYSPPDYESADTDYKQSASLTDLSSFSEQAVAISGALELTRNMTQLATYLKNTITFIEEQQAWLTNQTPKGTATTDLDKLIEDVEAVYTDLEQRLAQLSQEVLQT